MSDRDIHLGDDAEEAAMTQLLRLSAARPSMPAFREARVRAAVYARWRRDTRRRIVRTRMVIAALSLASAAALAVVAARLPARDEPRAVPGDIVATVEQVEGSPRRVRSAPDDRLATDLAATAQVRTGEWIETDARARVALRFSDGTSVRLDAGSRLRPVSAGIVELTAGAVYVDTGRESGRFEVRTPVATARDIGTQFELRLIDRAVRLRVRTGVVELRDGARSVAGRGGTEVTFSDRGAVSRSIAAHGSEWSWTAAIAPGLSIEGLALGSCLESLSREHGWTLVYGDPALAREAAGIVLHGSVERLSPQDALDVVLKTSGLTYRLADGELVVSRPAAAR
jgi:ferric-dicitrate binding protein FerR (iron transport regulator)